MEKKMKFEIAKIIGEEKEFQQPICYHGAVSTWGSLLSSLPFEIQIKIVSFIPPADVIYFGTCNKYWRDLCLSNWAWKLLSIKRWPLLSEFLTQSDPAEGYVIEDKPEEKCPQKIHVIEDNQAEEWPPNVEEIQKDWKQFYLERHNFVSAVSLERLTCGRILDSTNEFPNNHCTELANIGYSFIDVELISFSADEELIVNLIGVLYSIEFLKVPRKTVAEALRRRETHDYEIVEMRRLTELVYNALVPEKERGYTLTLEELVMGSADGHIKKKRIQIVNDYI